MKSVDSVLLEEETRQLLQLRNLVIENRWTYEEVEKFLTGVGFEFELQCQDCYCLDYKFENAASKEPYTLILFVETPGDEKLKCFGQYIDPQLNINTLDKGVAEAMKTRPVIDLQILG